MKCSIFVYICNFLYSSVEKIHDLVFIYNLAPLTLFVILPPLSPSLAGPNSKPSVPLLSGIEATPSSSSSSSSDGFSVNLG